MVAPRSYEAPVACLQRIADVYQAASEQETREASERAGQAVKLAASHAGAAATSGGGGVHPGPAAADGGSGGGQGAVGGGGHAGAAASGLAAGSQDVPWAVLP